MEARMKMTFNLLPSEHISELAKRLDPVLAAPNTWEMAIIKYLDDQFTSQNQRENQPKYEPKVTVEQAKAAIETLRQWALERIIQRKPFRYVCRGMLYSVRYDEAKGVGWWLLRYDRYERYLQEEYLITNVQASDAFLDW